MTSSGVRQSWAPPNARHNPPPAQRTTYNLPFPRDLKRRWSNRRLETRQQRIVETTNQPNPVPSVPSREHSLKKDDRDNSDRKDTLKRPASTSTCSSTAASDNTTIRDRDLYPALLSEVNMEFRRRIVLGDRIKNGIEYQGVFDGREAVDVLTDIVGDVRARDVALRLGRALGTLKVFHDVSYENRLIDSRLELYSFQDDNDYYSDDSSSLIASAGTTASGSSSFQDDNDDASSISILYGAAAAAIAAMDHERPANLARQNSHVVRPRGIFTELTRCYVPTCIGKKPCYSFSCPKRSLNLRKNTSLARRMTHVYLRQQAQPLWSTVVPRSTVESVSATERKRQEIIFELIYTEANYVKDLNYVNLMWIQPLRKQNIIPAERREQFIHAVFCNIMELHAVNARFLAALETRQKENPVVLHIGDIILDFLMDIEPYLQYGARQHEAKFVLDNERMYNPSFASFAQQTEQHPLSYRLELDGYLSKPTTRLGRYTLFLDNILKYTEETNMDSTYIPKASNMLRSFLARVNEENGKAKNRFDLERLYQKIQFKHKSDETDLELLDENRSIIKQLKLRKTPNKDSTEYNVILLDHCLLVTKMKLINGIERCIVQRRPVPLELLEVWIPNAPRRSNSLLPNLSTSTSLTTARHSIDSSRREVVANLENEKRPVHPISIRHLGRRGYGTFTLYASAAAISKTLLEYAKKQQSIRSQRQPVFDVVSAIQEGIPMRNAKVHHIVTFNGGQQYVLATENGVYVGHTGPSSKPVKVLSLPKTTQVHVLEQSQLLLVLADRVLWEYDLVVLNNKPEDQEPGRKVQSNVPYFHVGTSLERTLVCVPRVSALNSTITMYEPSRPQESRNKNIFNKLVRMPSSSSSSSSSGTHLKRFKDCYIPSEAWALELTATQLRITCPRGIIMVDMRTDKPQQMLNPHDKRLSFVTEREKDESRLNLRPPVKHISVFRTPLEDYLVCYDEYAFYIDRKGNRSYPNFLIEWEGSPEAFAFCYPYAVAFEPSFIEVRDVITGQLVQIIRGSRIQCLNNGHKAEKRVIFGVMDNPKRPFSPLIFQLQERQKPSQ